MAQQVKDPALSPRWRGFHLQLKKKKKKKDAWKGYLKCFQSLVRGEVEGSLFFIIEV